MSCKEAGCQNEVEGYCETCPETIYLCLAHMSTHKKKTQHIPKFMIPEQLKILEFKTLKSKIKNYISEMAKDTKKVITALKTASSKAIKNLKVSIRNLTQISQYKQFLFSKERINFLVEEVGQISQDFKNSKFNEMKNMPKMVQVLQEKIEKGKIQIFVKLFEEQIITLNAAPSDSIESLKIQIQKKLEFPLGQQRLTYFSKFLRDERTLADYNIKKESTLYLYF